jgi:hypothetical protein
MYEVMISIASILYIVMGVGVAVLWNSTPSGKMPNAAFILWPIILAVVAAKGND